MAPPASIGLTYRGTSVQDLDGIYLELVHGLAEPPEVRGEDLIVPASVGRHVRNRVADRRALRLSGWVRGTGVDPDAELADFAANRAAFTALFDTTLEPGALVATLEDGTVRTIDARTVPGVLWRQVVPSFAQVDVELESVEPEWAAGS